MTKTPGSAITMMLLTFAALQIPAAVPYPMGNGDYSQDFADIANWGNNFATGIGASNWSSVPIVGGGIIPDGQKTTVSSATFATSSTTGGIQRGGLAGSLNPAGTIVMLTTGTPDNSAAIAIDLNLDFSGRTAGTLSFNWAAVANSTGNRASSLRVYTSPDGINWTALAGAEALDLANNVAASGSVTAVALPSSLDGISTARIRFYECNGTGGTSGSRAKIAIDNVAVTSTPGSIVGPTIVVSPQDQSVLPQTATKFSVVAIGSTNLTYQWYKDGVAITDDSKFSGATSNVLTIADLNATNAGNYEVVVTNLAGAVTSTPPAVLSLISSGTLARWNFNNIENTSAPTPSSGDVSATTALNGNITGFINGTGSANDSGLPGWGTSTYPATGTSNKLAGPRFNVSTLGKKNVAVGYDVRSTSTASKYVRLQFTTNGTDFIDAPTSIVTPAVDANNFTTKGTSLVGFAGVDNNPNFGIRFVSEWETTATYGATNNNNHVAVSGTYNPSGTITYDIVTFTAEVTNANASPTISGIANFTILDSEPATNISLTVGDDAGAAGVTISATSSNQTAVSDGQFSYSGTGASRTLTFTPQSGNTGIAPIIVTATDSNGDVTKTWFYITVLPGNAAPTISAIARTNTLVSTPVSLPFTIGDDSTPLASLVISSNSGNTTLLPNANISISGSGSNRTVTLTPASSNEGVAPVTITVTDGGGKTASANFTLMVRASTNVLFVDNFDYSDGALISVSAGLYSTHGGTAGQIDVSSGLLNVTGSESEDVNGPLIDAPHSTSSPYALYSRFVVNASVSPDDIGNYFAHFKDDGTFNLRDRIFASTAGTNTPNTYRLGTGNTSGTTNTTAQFPLDLELGSNYVVVTRLILSNGVSTIWINPTNEASPSVTDSVAVGDPIAITTFAFRQSGGFGTLAVDDLKIAKTFNSAMGLPDVVAPSPESITSTVSGSDLILSWSQGNWTGLMTGTNVTAITNEIPGATSPYTNAISGPENYFRLYYKP